MKVEIEQVGSARQEGAVIRVVSMTQEIQEAIDILENNCRMIPVISGSENRLCKVDAIYYIESVDKRSYVYTRENCYETKLRLYELEERLGQPFLRCSKAMNRN